MHVNKKGYTVMKKYAIKEIPEIKILGRTGFFGDELPIFWHGSGIELNAKASNLYADVYADYDVRDLWVAIVINGAFISRFMLSRGLNHICLFRNMEPQIVKNVKLIRETQPMQDDPVCYMAVRSIWHDGTLETVNNRPYRLEFIGDSLTTGEGTYGAQNDMDWIPMYMSNTQQYSFMISNMLNADYQMVSQSGWGIHSAWDNNIHNVLSRIYEQISGGSESKNDVEAGAHDKYDFSFKPDAIIINLGTNDDGSFHNDAYTDPDTGISYKQHMDGDSYVPEDVQKVTDDTAELLNIIRKNNPNSFILWVYGMCGGELETAICEGIKKHAEATGDKNIDYLRISETTDETKGSREHPGLADHIKCSMEIATMLKSKLN